MGKPLTTRARYTTGAIGETRDLLRDLLDDIEQHRTELAACHLPAGIPARLDAAATALREAVQHLDHSVEDIQNL